MKTFMALPIFAATLARAAEVPARQPFDAAQGRPNIVFILVDDLGWRDLGCTGSKYYQTPNLDRLAADGMRFTRAYSTCMVCSPSRASIQRGLYPARHKLFLIPYEKPEAYREGRLPLMQFINLSPSIMSKNNLEMKPVWFYPALNPELPGFARELAANGYRTGYFGKWHLNGGSSSYPAAFGWQESSGFFIKAMSSVSHTIQPRYRTERFNFADAPVGRRVAEYQAEQTADYIRKNAGKPFCVMYAPYLVHTPFDGRKDLVEKYRKLPGDDQHNPVYAAMVEEMDGCVGKIMAALDELKLADNTLIIFTSDNGGLVPHATSNYPLLGGKSFGFEGGTRVPLIVRWPGRVKPGTLSNTPVIGTDFFPTILAAANLPQRPQNSPDGVNLMPLLLDAGSLRPRALFWHFPHYTGYTGPVTTMIDEENWKLIRYWNAQSGAYELYNLTADPNERTDLAAKNPDRIKTMAARLDAMLKDTGADLPERWKGYDPAKPTKFDRQATKELAETFRRDQEKRRKTETQP